MRRVDDVAAYFAQRVIPEPNSGCLLWTGSSDRAGYGVVNAGGKRLSAHRLGWSLQNGPIRDGLFVLHRCDTPACVNADHLFLGTQAENVADRHRKGRTVVTSNGFGLKTHCKRGHEFTAENTYTVCGKWRSCRECLRLHRRNYQLRKMSVSPTPTTDE